MSRKAFDRYLEQSNHGSTLRVVHTAMSCSRQAFAYIIVACLSLAAGKGAAATVFSDFLPGQAYDANVTQAVWGPTSAPAVSLGNPEETAALFSPGANYSLTQLDLALEYYQGTNQVGVSLWKDTSGLPASGSLGTEIASWSLSGLAANPGQVTSITNVSGVTLTAGTSYFLLVSPGASDTDAGWAVNRNVGYPAAPETTWGQYNGSSWQWEDPSTQVYSPAFDVVGTPSPVPLPATGWLLLAGLGGFGLISARAKATRSERPPSLG